MVEQADEGELFNWSATTLTLFHILLFPSNIILRVGWPYVKMLRFLASNNDMVISANKDLLHTDIKCRLPDGRLRAYIALNLSSLMVWCNESETMINLQNLSRTHWIHATICYDYIFESYMDFHKFCFKARSLLGGLGADEELWASTSLNMGRQHIVLRIGDRCALYALMSMFRDMLNLGEPTFNYHITLARW